MMGKRDPSAAAEDFSIVDLQTAKNLSAFSFFLGFEGSLEITSRKSQTARKLTAFDQPSFDMVKRVEIWEKGLIINLGLSSFK